MHKYSNNDVLLCADLCNRPSHVFNDHSNCKPSFCKMAAQLTKEPASAPISPISRSGSNSSMPDILDEIINLEIYRENDLHLEEDEARGGDCSIKRHNIPPDGLYFSIQIAGDRLVSMAPQLITNTTTNLAECYINIRCKFYERKFCNRVQRGSFQHRCYGAGLRIPMGPDRTCKTWLQATGSKPAEIKKRKAGPRRISSREVTTIVQVTM